MTGLVRPTIALKAGVKVHEKALAFSDLAAIAAAIQRQVTEHVAPIWGQDADVVAIPHGEHVPAGSWRCMIRHRLDEPGALGYHLDESNRPEALVMVTDDVSTTISHEVLEMLIDPSGNNTVPTILNNHYVRPLVEICDPPEAFAYDIGGVAVSDFVLPAYYASHAPWGPGVVEESGRRLSYLDKLSQPLSVAPGGYLSYENLATGQWEQITWFGGDGPIRRILGRYDEAQQHDWRSLRAYVDHHTDQAEFIGTAKFQ